MFRRLCKTLCLCAHLRMGNVVNANHFVDRVLILFAFRLLHCLCFVNPIPAGRLKPLFFCVLFSMSFCLSAPDRDDYFLESEKVFCWPRCLKQLDGAEFCIERPTGLPRIALYILRDAFIINNSAPTNACPICYIPLLFSTAVLYISVCVDSLINKLYPLTKKLTADNVIVMKSNCK